MVAPIFQPPPTWADPIIEGPVEDTWVFNPVWLNWFLEFSKDASSSGAGSVSSVAESFTGGLISVSGSPVTTTGTLALTVAGTSGGVPYFSGAATWASSAALTANQIVVGGGVGNPPAALGSLGTTSTVLHGNAAGAPTYSAVSLTADVSGILPDGNIAATLTGKTYNGLTLTAQTIGFTVAGGTTSKTLTVPLDASVSGTNTGDQDLSGYLTAVTADTPLSGSGTSASHLVINLSDTLAFAAAQG